MVGAAGWWWCWFGSADGSVVTRLWKQGNVVEIVLAHWHYCKSSMGMVLVIGNHEQVNWLISVGRTVGCVGVV